MMQKDGRPWFWNLSGQITQNLPDGPYATKLDTLYKDIQNGSGRPPSDAMMDFCACNLALALKK